MLVVVGGNGFVGSHVIKEALTQGMQVVSLNRTGRPNWSEGWVDQVSWLTGDMLDDPKDDLKEALSQAKGVVSAVGCFGSNEKMERINGLLNVKAVDVAKQHGVPRFVFVSVHDYKHMPGAVLPGYFGGKRRAEDTVNKTYGHAGTIIRPGMIYGTRKVGSMSLPMGAIGAPLKMITDNSFVQSLNSLPLIGAVLEPALVPPVPVQAVARVAVDAVTRELPAQPEGASAGSMRIVEVPDILQMA